MLRARMNENVAVHKAPERQPTVQGKLSTGRVVEQNRVTIQTPGQMEGASSTSRRTITHHSEAVHSRAVRSVVVKRTADFPTEAISAKKSRKSETAGHQPAQLFKKQVDSAVRKLHKDRKNAPDDWSFCLMVVDTFKTLNQDFGRIKNQLRPGERRECMQYVKSGMNRPYNESLAGALKFFHEQMATGNDWIYSDKFDQITRCFDKPGRISVNAERNNAWLKEIWNLHLDNELNYLRYLKGFPNVSYSAWRTVNNINWLISVTSPAFLLGWINDERRDEIKIQANSLYCEIVNSDMDHSNAGKERENVSHKPTDAMMEKRKHYDLLFRQHSMLRDNKNSQRSDDSGILHHRQRIHFLQELFKLYGEYNKLVGDPRTLLFGELNRLITQHINEARNKLEKGVYDGDQTLKEEVSLLISDPEKEKWLTEEDNNLDSVCTRSQNTVIPAIPEYTITDEKFHEVITDIFKLLHNDTRDCGMMALGLLKQLLDKHGCQLKNFSKRQSERLQKRLGSIGRTLFARLFAPVFADYNDGDQSHGRPRGTAWRCAVMCCHKERIIELNPYVHLPQPVVVNSYKARHAWKCAACFAWLNDIRQLCCQTSFAEKDVDNLLDLKDVAPDLPSYEVWDYLMTALPELFRFMLQTNPDAALVEKVTKLSEWIDDLDRQDRHNRKVSHDLYKCNRKWRKKHVGRARERATTTQVCRQQGRHHPRIPAH